MYIIILSLTLACAFSWAQLADIPSDKRQSYMPSATLPATVRFYGKALGQRLGVAGQERVTMLGTIQRGVAVTGATLIWETPGKFRLQETSGRGRLLAIDGSAVTSVGALDSEAEDLLESLGLDTAEEFIFNVGRSQPYRMLGQRFRVQNEIKDSFGSEVDVFEFPVPVRGRKDAAQRVKLVMFDSWTGQLRRVAYTIYREGKPVRVETVLGPYTKVGNDSWPTDIARLEDGRLVLKFTRSVVSVSPSANDAAFRVQ